MGRSVERAHAMRWDADAQYGGSVYDDLMKGSPQESSLRGIVNGLTCPRIQCFNVQDGVVEVSST
jgi:hypothetical protein